MSNEAPDFLSMSDEEWAALDHSSVVEEQEVEQEEVEVEQPEVAPETEEPAGQESEPEEVAEPEAADEPEGEEGNAEGDDADPAKEPEVDTPEKPEEVKPETKAIDYEAEYKKVFAPFRANGKEMQIQSADDAIALMQMGANYNKKMAALKPNLKLLKLLENNGLLSEEKLSFLIDLDKKNPDAIGKLIKDSGIDPLDMDVSKSEYKPNTYTVDEREMEFDSVLEEIQDTPSYSQTINIVSTKWDGPSKQVVAQNPQLLKVINSHVASGIYDLISTEIERERVFGRLQGLSDIEAYRTVGDAMDARGAFAHLAQPQKQTPAPVATPVAVPQKPKVDDAAARAKKIAAGVPRTAPAKSEPVDFNPLAMSDDEFSKLGNPRLM